MSISELIYNALGDYGDAGVLLCVFLIFMIDALIFPALPELFFILGYAYNPTPVFGMLLIGAAVAAELAGIYSLYYIVKHIRIPKKIGKVMDKYVNFLMV
ncbi:MAG: hypothetical protein J5494_07190, partial [Candidatus Methanomethylophilaceae archaeon]|nr:hypothetical protein [Candidatus Methanomethylophilaceae archaeon]